MVAMIVSITIILAPTATAMGLFLVYCWLVDIYDDLRKLRVDYLPASIKTLMA